MTHSGHCAILMAMIPLCVPFSRKEEARQDGARWHPKQRVWQCDRDLLPSPAYPALRPFMPRMFRPEPSAPFIRPWMVPQTLWRRTCERFSPVNNRAWYAVRLMRRAASDAPIALQCRPPHRARGAYSEPRCSRPAGHASRNGTNNPLPQVHRQRLAHLTGLPWPVTSLNQTSAPLGIPQRFTPFVLCFSLECPQLGRRAEGIVVSLQARTGDDSWRFKHRSGAQYHRHRTLRAGCASVGLRPPSAAISTNGAPTILGTPLNGGGPFWTPIDTLLKVFAIG